MLKLELVSLLERHEIPTARWGKKDAKTIEELLTEVNRGEAQLVSERGKLYRLINGALVDVWYHESAIPLRLKEDRQEFVDGRPPRRRKLRWSLGETLREGESALGAAGRGLREEMGVTSELTIIPVSEVPRVLKPSLARSYPGIWSRITVETFVVSLSTHQYRPEGYVERRDGRVSYFVWTKTR